MSAVVLFAAVTVDDDDDDDEAEEEEEEPEPESAEREPDEELLLLRDFPSLFPLPSRRLGDDDEEDEDGRAVPCDAGGSMSAIWVRFF